MPAVADGSHRVESSNRYRLKLPDGSIIGPLPFADIVRRLVTTALPAETQISRDAGAYMAPAEISELRRYVLNKSDRWTGPSPDRSEHRGGSLRGGELVAETHRLIDERGTGMVHLTHGSRQKRIYFVDGRPGYVASNSADELFGEFLVRRGTLLRMELEMALAMLAEFDGRLGDAVVGLGILRPMQLFHAVRQQVRERFLEAFRWEDGHWYFVENERTAEETIPLAGSEHELLRDAANEVPHRQLKAALAACIDRPLVTAERFDAVALSYRLPVPWLELMRGLEPPTSLSTLLTRERKFGEEALYRLVFMGLRCGLLKLGDGDATPHSA